MPSLAFYGIAALAGLAVALVFRKPRTLAEVGELLALSLGGLLLLLPAAGAIHAFGSPRWRAWAADPHTRAGAVGIAVALGGSLWSVLRQTLNDTQEMNLFEAWAWIKAGGKLPPARKKREKRDE
jgi:hypothetical protein